MHDDSSAGRPAAPPHRRREVIAAGEPGSSGQQRQVSAEQADQADNSVRPLPRRAAMMARPARVRIRKRNPWVRARRRLFGWNVRLPLATAVVLLILGSHIAGSQPSGLRVISSARGDRTGSMGEARKNTRWWAGDGPSVDAWHRLRQNQRRASPSERHAVTSMVLAYTGFLWQHPRLVSLRRLTTVGGGSARWHVGDRGA